MVTKATQFLILGSLVGFFSTISGCSGFGLSRQRPHLDPQFVVNWVKPTYDGSEDQESNGSIASQTFRTHRKMNRMAPVVTEKLVIQGNNLRDLVAYDRKHWGREVWKKNFKGGVEAGALAFKDRLYVTANDGTVSALEISTGRTLWSFPTSSENISMPVLDAETGLLYFQNAQNMVFCLDAQSGKQVWLYSKVDAALITIRGAATPTVYQGQVFVGFSDGSFVSLKASSGQILWDAGLNRNKKFRDVDAQAVIYKDMVIVSGYDDKVYALDMKKGTVLWTYNTGSDVAATLADGYLYVGSSSGSVVKLKADSGEAVWTYTQVKGVPTQIVVYRDYLLFGESQGWLKVLNKNDGKLRASYEPGRGIFSKPFVDEKSSEIYFVSGEAYLYNLKFIENARESFFFVN